MNAPQKQVIPLFPTPIMIVPKVLAPDLLNRLVDRIRGEHRDLNAHSRQLSHTKMVSAAVDPLYAEAAGSMRAAVTEFGGLLFGEALSWKIKEIWVNLLETGGNQAIHNHANSFVSGIVYLTSFHPGSGTVFHKQLGGSDFSFVNNNARTKMGPFNASRWQAPAMSPGDLLLFPSYMLHEVPQNQGAQRITMAFNALPEKLDSHGYTVSFA